MSALEKFDKAVSELGLIAILRGVKPDEVVAIGHALYSQGYRILEVPLNSPDPYSSIKQLVTNMPQDTICGAGTVVSPDMAERAVAAGAQIVVCPDMNPGVAETLLEQDIVYCPGVATPSEAFAALDSGAAAIKFFPAEMILPSVVKAMHAVLPPETKTFPVGGIDTSNMGSYLKAGATGFGIGSSLYRPGRSIADLSGRAAGLADAFQRAKAGQ